MSKKQLKPPETKQELTIEHFQASIQQINVKLQTLNQNMNELISYLNAAINIAVQLINTKEAKLKELQCPVKTPGGQK